MTHAARSLLLLGIGGLILSGCGAAGRLANVGKAPKFTATAELDAPYIEPSLGERGGRGARATRAFPAPHHEPVTDAGRAALQNGGQPPAPPVSSASLFRTGAGAFLRGQRASRIGDIVTIRIRIDDRAEVANTTSRSRSGNENAGIPALLGLQNLLPASIDPANLVSSNSTSNNTGTGTSARSERVEMTVAAIVTDVLPNGNLLIKGRQEVRVNFELRELIVSGIVRPEDITRDNSVAHSQIAEARISYGGRGQLTDVQQARWGQQIYNALFPF